MARRARLPAVAVACVLPLAVAFPTAAGDEIVVAAVSTHASPLQPGGGDVRGAVRAAVDRINAKGGLIGRRVMVVEHDDRCDRGEAARVAARVAAERAALVVGHVCAGAAIAAAAVYAPAGIAMIAPGARHPRLTSPRGGPLVFRLAGREDRLAIELGEIVARRFAGHRTAVLHDKSAQARGLADAFERELKALAVVPVLREAYVAGEKQYHAVVDKLIAANVQVVVMPAQPIEAGIILARLAATGHAMTMIGTEILAVPAIEATAKLAGDHLLLMLPWTPAPPGAGIRPDATAGSVIGAFATAAVEAWAHAVEKAGSLDGAAVGRVLESETAATSIGALRFDARGDAMIPSYALSAWRDGRWRPVGP